MFSLWVRGSDFKYNKTLCGLSYICFLLCPIDILWLSINNTHAGVISHSWRVKVMHHKAGSFQSEFISQKCHVYGSWRVYSIKRKNTRQLNKNNVNILKQVRPKGRREVSVLGPDLRLVSAGVTKCFVFRAEQLREPKLPARHVRRSRERSNVQLLRGRRSTERNNLCCNNGAVKSFHKQIFMFCCLCGAGSTCWLQAIEDWSVSMFTFQEERLGGLVCIGLKQLVLLANDGGGGAETWNYSVTTIVLTGTANIRQNLKLKV